jgi:allantoate deiminase
VLVALNGPAGVVTAIERLGVFNVEFLGVAGHAGTVPMQLRHDALCAAAEFILAVEALARAEPGLVATIGQIALHPGASNVIPGVVSLSLDVRHQDDAVREQACGRLHQQATEIGAARGTRIDWQVVQEHRAVPCAPALVALLARAIETLGYSALPLPSGAGHDGAMLSTLTPFAMLFVRCKGGVSHNPAESVAVADVAVAVETLSQFLELLAERQ